jgi:hypothetical protein
VIEGSQGRAFCQALPKFSLSNGIAIAPKTFYLAKALLGTVYELDFFGREVRQMQNSYLDAHFLRPND